MEAIETAVPVDAAAKEAVEVTELEDAAVESIVDEPMQIVAAQSVEAIDVHRDPTWPPQMGNSPVPLIAAQMSWV